ncbi:MAG: 50S ribosomal protein L11 methyltransferase [Actinomycetota bacterium]
MRRAPLDATTTWSDVAARLDVAGAGVHRPSSFSIHLAEVLQTPASQLHGRTVVDAGCGSGLIAIAALAAGAAHVLAQDGDRAALDSTRHNVDAILGTEALDRVSFVECDWQHLGLLRADVLVVNPPQRPSRAQRATDAEELHLHDGGGADGVDAMRLVLTAARTDEVISTASALLDEAPLQLTTARFGPPHVISDSVVHHAAPWRSIHPDAEHPVRVLRWRRLGGATS